MCQRSTTCPGDTPCASAIPVRTGSISRSPRPSGLQLSVTIPCAARNSRSAAWGKEGCSSTWLTAGTTPVSSASRVGCASVKSETPIDRIRPCSRSSIMARQLAT
ncbi:MAG: hypothetical protein ABT15_25930 [Pseudonocardia sp. SCN 73-27]|nr:MAG: hypothetical protein ABS80_09715 [Pseudonocardia sp. SCN 72-51]ODV02319.1 MAG: hypothetical protein ABT15_25930 [Pseudonocardia sp. SCN 73-27]